MMLYQRGITRQYSVYLFGALLGASLLLVGGVSPQRALAQEANSIYTTPASGAYTVGDTVIVSVRENSTTSVNAISADLTYSNNLQFLNTEGSGSAFSIDASSGGSNGTVSIARGTITPVSGDQLVSKVSFKVVGNGVGSIKVLDSSMTLSSTTNENVATVRNGSSLTLRGVAIAVLDGAVTAPSGRSSAASKTAPKATVSIAPKGSAQATALPSDSVVELEAPATIETTTDTTKQVTKVEYIVNGKVVATDTTPPYTHDFDVKHMRNGTYAVSSKTYYKDGSSDISNSSLKVSNPLSLMQVLLQIRHYAWVVVIVLIVIGELLYLKHSKAKRSNNFTGTGFEGFGPSSGSNSKPAANSSPAGPVITPSSTPFVQPVVTAPPTQPPATLQS